MPSIYVRTNQPWQDWEREILARAARKQITTYTEVHQLAKRFLRNPPSIRKAMYDMRASGDWEQWIEEKQRLLKQATY